ncbi:MAG: DUF1501 domain-containing protein [Bryobacter sp.]|nr:DUF1501 domain-containing protein [Bryobacter sp.]
MSTNEHVRWTRNRREFLTDAFCGMGLLGAAALEAQGAKFNPLAAKQPHHAAKAKRMIFLFMAGGPSQMETFDPKPLLNELHGQKRPAEFGEAKYQFVAKDAKLLGTKRTFQKYGQSGIEVSDLFPHTAQQVDKLAILRSCHGDMVVHSAAQYQMMTGRIIPGFPSMGSWMVYGLGNEADNLPAYCVLPDPDGALEAGQPMYMHGFLPAVYQPTMMRPGKRPVLNLDLPAGVEIEERSKTVKYIKALNRAAMNGEDTELEARIAAYDLAFKMQMEAPEIFDIRKEDAKTLEMYGVGKEPTDDYGRRCLLARRLVEKGVRVVTVVSGGGPGNLQWDAHDDIEENHLRMAAQTDQPVAALLKDLEQRGMLEDTLVFWGGEFGRSPESQGSKGRDHHNLGFTMWMAGGGVKGGMVHGATDAIGLRAIEKPAHFRDVHTTLLHLMGLNQHALSYMHLGRKERLTEIEGSVIKEILA